MELMPNGDKYIIWNDVLMINASVVDDGFARTRVFVSIATACYLF